MRSIGTGKNTGQETFVLVTFVPVKHREALLEAIFSAGAGRYGNYGRCAFVCPGEGRFRPDPGSRPYLGEPGVDERTAEDRIECLVGNDQVEAVLEALRSAHPYEEPAVYLYALDPRCLGATRGPGGTEPSGSGRVQDSITELPGTEPADD